MPLSTILQLYHARRSVLLVEETGVPRENTNLQQVTDKLKLSRNVVSSTPRHVRDLNPQL